MKRICLEKAECAIARALEVVGDWWSLLIVRDAMLGRTRFGEFQESLGVAKNILAARLKKLVAGGVFELVPAADGSSFQEYRLTEKGRGLFIVLIALRQWGEECLYQEGQSGSVLVDRKDGQPVRPLALRSHNGRTLGPADVDFIPAKESRQP